MENTEGPKVEFNTRVVKQGNSLCVRLPKEFAEQMDIFEGSFVKTTIQKTDVWNLPQWMLKIYRKHLDQYIREFTDRELNILLHCAGIKEGLLRTEKDKKKHKQIEEIYTKSVEIERGPEFVDKWKKLEKLTKSKEVKDIFVKKIIPELKSNKEHGKLFISTLRKRKNEEKKSKK